MLARLHLLSVIRCGYDDYDDTRYSGSTVPRYAKSSEPLSFVRPAGPCYENQVPVRLSVRIRKEDGGIVWRRGNARTVASKSTCTIQHKRDAGDVSCRGQRRSRRSPSDSMGRNTTSTSNGSTKSLFRTSTERQVASAKTAGGGGCRWKSTTLKIARLTHNSRWCSQTYSTSASLAIDARQTTRYNQVQPSGWFCLRLAASLLVVLFPQLSGKNSINLLQSIPT